jgi:integrase
MIPEVAAVLARLSQRDDHTGDDDLVFVGERGGFLDDSALRRRYAETQKRAKLRPLRFHDLRHVFGSLAIDRASIVQVQAWMGHADVDTTMRYLHHKSRAGDAALLAEAFKPAKPASALQAEGVHTDASAGTRDATAGDVSPAKPAVRRQEAERDDGR